MNCCVLLVVCFAEIVDERADCVWSCFVEDVWGFVALALGAIVFCNLFKYDSIMLGFYWLRQVGYKACRSWVPAARGVVKCYEQLPLSTNCKASGRNEGGNSGVNFNPKKGNKLRLDDACLALFPGHSKAKIQSWIALGKVLVNDKVVNKSGAPVSSTASIVVTAVEPKFVCRYGEHQ